MMPSFIVKPMRDEDFYVEWSTVVDAPLAYGTRAEIGANFTAMANLDRLDRADQYGTSMMDPHMPRDEQWFGWAEDEFMVREVIPDERVDGAYYVSRQHVRALCERLAAEQDPTDLLRFEPDEDES